jgi:hypothetical protein
MQVSYILAAILGAGLIGFLTLRRFESMVGKSLDELRAYLRSPEWMFYRKALQELVRRGEDIKADVPPILELVISESKSKRTAGWMILKEFYPDLASRVTDYKPLEPPEVCREKMQNIFLRTTLQTG